MSSARNAAATLLRLVSSFVDKLSDDEIDALLAGRIGLHVTDGEATFSTKRKNPPKHVDLDSVVEALTQARTRQDATEILERDGLSKAVLEKLARRLDLPVLRSDSVDRLRQRIVEGSVGYRINSEAIQGVHPLETAG